MSDEDSPYTGVKRGDFARAKNEVIIREHEYDGIQEYDQKLPNWWLFTFYGAIVWFVLHWCIYYYVTGIDTDQERITAAVAEMQIRKEDKLAATLAELDDRTLIETWATNQEIVARGQAIYSIHCVACHAADLSGKMQVGDQSIPLPGLALDDGEWKYGKEPMATFKIINEGTPPDSPGHNGAKMQAWGQILTPQEVAEVTAYLIAENPDDFIN